MKPILTVVAFHQALKAIIGNMPERAVEIDIRLRPDEIPTMTVIQHMLDAHGDYIIGGDEGVPQVEIKAFVIVEEERFLSMQELLNALVRLSTPEEFQAVVAALEQAAA